MHRFLKTSHSPLSCAYNPSAGWNILHLCLYQRKLSEKVIFLTYHRIHYLAYHDEYKKHIYINILITIFHSAIVNKMRAKRCFPAADCYNGDVLLFQGNFAFCRCIWHIKWNMDWFNGSDDRRMGVVRWNCRGLFLGTESTERRRWTLCTNCSKSKLALLRLYLHKQLPCIMRI